MGRRAGAPPGRRPTRTCSTGRARSPRRLSPWRCCGFAARAGDGSWTGLGGYSAGEPLRPVHGEDGRVVALDLASHTYPRLPYDVDAPVPGGVDPGG